MATTEELEKEILAEMAADPVAYAAGPVNDTITIDGETRVISVPASEILFGVETDKDVERKHFRCPKIVGDNIDLSKHQIYISYITSDSTGRSFSGDASLYLCEDMAVDGDDITFSWQLSGNVFAGAGFIAFKVLAAKTDGENVQTRWNTVPAVGTVLMTVPDGMDIAETYPDIVTQLLERMASVEKIATEEAMQGYVNTYLEAHPAEIDETLTDPKKAAPADVVGELKEDIDDIENSAFNVEKSRNLLNPANFIKNSWLLSDGTIQTPSPYGTDTSVYSGAVIGGNSIYMTYQQGETKRDIFSASRCVFQDKEGTVVGNLGQTLMNGIVVPDTATSIKILFNTASLSTKLQMEYGSISDYMEYGTKILSLKDSDIKADATFFVPTYLYAYSGTMRYIDKMNVVASNSDDLMYFESPKDDPSRGKKDKLCAIYGVTKIDVKSKITDAVLFSKEIGITKVDVTQKSNPSNIVNVMIIGDSYTGNNILPCDIKNQLVNTHAFTNYIFVGGRSGTDNEVICNHEGRAGYSVADYLKKNNSDGRGTKFPNPYYSNGQVSIKTYCDNNNISHPNVFILELGINDIENGLIGNGVHGTLNERIKYMVDLIHSEFPDAKILLVGVVYASINNGQASYVSKNKNRMKYNQNLENIALSDNYKTFVKYCDVGALFDTVNGYGWTEKSPYRGSTVTEKEISDWLHPCRAGYYMESDCIVPAILDFNIS